MNTLLDIIDGRKYIAVVGLGYVGLPIAVALAEKTAVIGFDINKEKVELYKKGIDPTNEIGNKRLKDAEVEFTSDEKRLKDASFFIIAVPTPVNPDHTPDLEPLKAASRIVGRNMPADSMVVFESTVYPGVTEDICIPILEEESGMKCGIDFKAGYSPERINPGDKKHRLESITKVVSGTDEEALDTIASVYGLVVKAGIYKASSIKVAEAAKVIENSQRDINIAFMNELSIIFNKMGIDTKEVLGAAGTKWNFLNFQPGLVGGHCIGVDPYYLTYKAEQIGYHSQIILSGRRINDSMGKYIAETLIKKLIKNKILVRESKVAILGFTFKENCPDTRNTKVIDIVNELMEYGVTPLVTDPIADPAETERLYGIRFVELEDIDDVDALVVAVGHEEYKKLTVNKLKGLYKGNDNNRVILDVKGILDKQKLTENGFKYWRL